MSSYTKTWLHWKIVEVEISRFNTPPPLSAKVGNVSEFDLNLSITEAEHKFTDAYKINVYKELF